MSSALEPHVTDPEAREILFTFPLPASDARWLALEVAKRVATAQRLIVIALYDIRHGGSQFLRELMASDNPGKRARPTATTKKTVLRLTEDEARWVFVEAARRFTTAPRLLARIVCDIHMGGSPLLSELMRLTPPTDPAPLEQPSPGLRTEVRLRLSDAAWFHVQATRRTVSASNLLVLTLQGVREGGSPLVAELCAAGDARRATPPTDKEPTRRLSFVFAGDDLRWLNMACATRLLTTQQFLEQLVRALRSGGDDFLRELLGSAALVKSKDKRKPA